MGQVGVQIFTVGGMLIGSYFGGPVGGMLGSMAGGLIGSAIFGGSQKPLIPDYQMAGANWGHPVPMIFGQVRLSGTFLWESEIATHGNGGKGTGGGAAASYWQSAALGFCEGPATLLKIWFDGKLFYDCTATNPQELTKHRFAMRSYGGGEDQMPDPLVADWVRRHVIPGDACPAYRGIAYLVMQQVDIANYGNRFPNVTALWSTTADDHVIIKKLNRWADDVSTDHSAGLSFYGSGVCVDWVRGLVVQKSNDGTLRVFDITSGQCIAAKTWAQVWGGEDKIPTDLSGFFGEALGPQKLMPYAMALVPGGDLYISSSAYVWVPTHLWTLDLASLTPKAVLGNDIVVADMSWMLRLGPCQVPTTSGWQDVLLGGYFGPLKVIYPETGHVYDVDLPYGGTFFQSHDWAVGGANMAAGTVQIWIVSASSLYSDGDGVENPLHILNLTITQDSPLAPSEEWLKPVALPEDFTITHANLGLAGSTTPFGAWQIIYDPTDDTVILSSYGLNMTFKWSPVTGVVWQRDGYTANPNCTHDYFQAVGGQFGDGFVNRNFWVMQTYAGQRADTWMTPSDYATVEPYETYGYHSATNSVVFGRGGNLYVAYLQRKQVTDYPVADIITKLCDLAGLSIDMIDVSEITDTCIGYSVLGSRPVGDLLADLCNTFHIDQVESDYRLKFVPRGKAPAATITQDELGLLSADSPASYWQPKRAQETELPLQINLRHIDPAFDFQPNAVYARRTAAPVQTQWSKRVKSVDLPVIATSDQAQRIAESWLYTLWAERDTYQTVFSPAYIWLDPGDNVTINLNSGDSYTVRIESTDLGTDYSIQAGVASEDATTYGRSAAARGASISYTPQVVVADPYATLLLLDLPLLRDEDDLGGVASRIYYAGEPSSPMPVGASATVFKSADTTAWLTFGTLTTFPGWGYVRTALPGTTAWASIDYDHTLTVDFAAGSMLPSSCSYDELMSGANAAALGGEVLQFQTVTDNSDGSVTLSVLLRGQRGTEWAVGSHSGGESVVLLAPGPVQPGRIGLSEIGVAEYWRLVPSGRDFDEMPTQGAILHGRDLMPYAPVHLARAASGSDLVLSWVRRTRIGGILMDGTDTAPLGEASEAYEAYLLPNAAALAAFDPTNPATYRRAFTGMSAPNVTYTATMIAADGVTPATDTLFLVVYQLSAVIGRGFRAYAALPAF